MKCKGHGDVWKAAEQREQEWMQVCGVMMRAGVPWPCGSKKWFRFPMVAAVKANR